ncbi:hypothetical protein, partial [Escherichia coli]|uniref:hypothetical protein n=1 Tax=Escherichia coli TaxID=562 RepID=UPI001BC8A42F
PPLSQTRDIPLLATKNLKSHTRPANVFTYFSHKLICSQSTTTVITGHFQYFIKLKFLAQMNSSSTNSLYG